MGCNSNFSHCQARLPEDHDESGEAHGSPGTGQSWQIGDPWTNNNNIIDNLSAGTLSNTFRAFGPDDVAMALGWAFTLLSDETATVRFIVGDTLPLLLPGFYLSQTDPSGITLSFYSVLDIHSQGVSIPEPVTVLLLSTGLAGLLAGRRYFWSKPG